MLRVAIVGGSGYTGSELIRLLTTHPEQVELTCVTSRTYEGQRVDRVNPNVRGLVDLTFENPDIEKVADNADIVFLALPHKFAMEYAPGFLDLGKKVIDFSADYRFNDAEIYEEHYQEHTSPHLLAESAYGLPELHRSEIGEASLVAVPGCYPTGAILALTPALKSGAVELEGIIIDSKTGISGAGKSASAVTHFPNRQENFTAYKIGEHRHSPEIKQELDGAVGKNVEICFVPHLAPMTRGILTTAYIKMKKSISTSELLAAYSDFYKDETFVRVLDEGEIAQTQSVRGSNYCDVCVKVVEKSNLVVAISAIDNLTKGSAGAALQNMNILAGFDETAGLLAPGLMP